MECSEGEEKGTEIAREMAVAGKLLAKAKHQAQEEAARRKERRCVL
jgi:hypothetical protein